MLIAIIVLYILGAALGFDQERDGGTQKRLWFLAGLLWPLISAVAILYIINDLFEWLTLSDNDEVDEDNEEDADEIWG